MTKEIIAKVDETSIEDRLYWDGNSWVDDWTKAKGLTRQEMKTFKGYFFTGVTGYLLKINRQQGTSKKDAFVRYFLFDKLASKIKNNEY